MKDENLNLSSGGPFPNSLKTEDESWVHIKTSDTKPDSMHLQTMNKNS